MPASQEVLGWLDHQVCQVSMEHQGNQAYLGNQGNQEVRDSPACQVIPAPKVNWELQVHRV